MIREGDTVRSFLRPDERYIVLSVDHKTKMVVCRAPDGREFATSRMNLTKIETV